MQPGPIAWAGSYAIVDPPTQLDVRVLVSGRFDGTLANPAAIDALQALVVRAVGEAVAGWVAGEPGVAGRPHSVLQLFTVKDTLIEGVRARIAPALHDLGAQGQLSLDTVAFDEDSRARLMAANAEIAKRVRAKMAQERAEAEAAKAAAPQLEEPAALAPGTHVLVQWSDGNRYPAVLQQSAREQCLVAFPNGTQQWVPAHAVSKA
jgi:hypothetical protein